VQDNVKWEMVFNEIFEENHNTKDSDGIVTQWLDILYKLVRSYYWHTVPTKRYFRQLC